MARTRKPLAVAVDRAGNVAVAGWFLGTVDLGHGGRDMFLALYTSSGRHLWSKVFGGTGDDSANAVAIDPTDSSGNALIVAPGGAVVCVGAFAGSGQLEGTQIDAEGPSAEEAFEDLVLAAYSGRGEPRWVLHFGSGSHTSVAAVRDPAGALIVVGHFQGALGDTFLPLSRGGVFLMKLVPR